MYHFQSVQLTKLFFWSYSESVYTHTWENGFQISHHCSPGNIQLNRNTMQLIYLNRYWESPITVGSCQRWTLTQIVTISLLKYSTIVPIHRVQAWAIICFTARPSRILDPVFLLNRRSLQIRRMKKLKHLIWIRVLVSFVLYVSFLALTRLL